MSAPSDKEPITREAAVAIARNVAKKHARPTIAQQTIQAPKQAPRLFWLIGILWMAYGVFRMERHGHEVFTWTERSGDWLFILVGIAFIPGAAEQIGNGFVAFGRGARSFLGAIASFLGAVKGTRNGDQP